jgi:hypothetical protein
MLTEPRRDDQYFEFRSEFGKKSSSIRCLNLCKNKKHYRTGNAILRYVQRAIIVK